jgi:FkbM family methyltransferase
MLNRTRTPISTLILILSYYVKEFGVAIGIVRFVVDRLKHHLPAAGAVVKVWAPRHGEIFIRAHTSDLAVFVQTFLLFESDITKLKQFDALKSRYEDILRRGKVPVVIDGGGYIGTVSVFLSHVFPRAQIILVEPDDQNIEIARRNTGMLPNVDCRRSALWSSSASMRLLTDSGSFEWAISVTPINDNNVIDELAGITATTIDDIMSEIIDGELLLLKLDIEGAENEAVSPDSNWVKAYPVCIIEPHDWMIPRHASLKNLLTIPPYRDGDIIICGENLVFFPAY